jgi:hypothetical protein
MGASVSRVFISYAQNDTPLVRKLVAELRNLTVAGWMDASDIAGGAVISSAVRDALQRSAAVLVLLSPRALQSRWVQFEIGAAEALGKPIIPVIIEGDNLEEQMPAYLKQRQWLDARYKSPAEVARLIERVLMYGSLA